MSVQLTITAYKASQKAGVTLNANGTMRTKDGSDRSSILLTSEVHTVSNGAVWTKKRVANMSMPTSLAATFDLTEGDDISSQLKAIFGTDHTIVMVEDIKPFYKGQGPKTRGEGGAVITDDSGNPIYQDFRVAPVGSADIKVDRTIGVTSAPEEVLEQGEI